MAEQNEFFKTPVWYPVLAAHTFLTSFVKLRPEAVAALAQGEIVMGDAHPEVGDAIADLRQPMSVIPGNCFASVDTCAPTDTERFLYKHGSVHSPESAWRYLALSRKVRTAAANGEVQYICLRPFRRMNRTREFRLFIKNGDLSAMSQYHLIRHFRRLEGYKKAFWTEALGFVREISWMLPVKDLTMDIYFTSEHRILIIDLNPWGDPTDPLLLRTWNRDWSEPAGIVLMPPPVTVSGDVNVSF